MALLKQSSKQRIAKESPFEAKNHNRIAVTETMDPPRQWPQEVIDEYDAVRTLGKGGFASVVLARKKNPKDDEIDGVVAIKVVAASTEAEAGYAHREIRILQELSHPRIMRLVDFWEPTSIQSGSVAVMALSYAKGPTLQFLLKSGAPTVAFARVVLSQLVDAVAYMHSRATLHRDIKPDNLIISGASSKQSEIWDDRKIEHHTDFARLRKKWHVTLVDFGFARALSKDEVQTDSGFRKSVIGKPSASAKLSHSVHSDLNEAIDMSAHSSIDSSARSKVLDRSYSRVIVRKMSALGNRDYAAPEVVNGVKKEKVEKDGHTLSAFVSDYGMVADAFSVGATMRYTLSGVPPDKNIADTIAAQNNPLSKVGRWLGKKTKRTKSKAMKREKKYRSISEFPGEVTRLIQGLMHWNPKERTTVRVARLYPWIDDALEDSNHWTRQEVIYLDCASDQR